MTERKCEGCKWHSRGIATKQGVCLNLKGRQYFSKDERNEEDGLCGKEGRLWQPKD